MAAKRTSAKKYSAVPTTAKRPMAAKADAAPAVQATAAAAPAEIKVTTATAPAATPVAAAAVAEAKPTSPVVAQTTTAAPKVDAAKAAPDAAAVAAQPAAATPVPAAPTPAAPPANDAMTHHVQTLIAELNNPSADVAREAAVALGTAGDRSAVRSLAAAVENADGYFHPVVRAAAAASLGQLGDAWAVSALLNGVYDEMAEASAESVRALAAIGDAQAVRPLVKVVRNVDGFFLPVVRRAAVLALAKLGGDEAAEVLKAVAADEHESQAVRQAAVEAAR